MGYCYKQNVPFSSIASIVPGNSHVLATIGLMVWHMKNVQKKGGVKHINRQKTMVPRRNLLNALGTLLLFKTKLLWGTEQFVWVEGCIIYICLFW